MHNTQKQNISAEAFEWSYAYISNNFFYMQRANYPMLSRPCVSHLAVMFLKYIMGNLNSITSHLLWEDLPLSLPQQDQQAEEGEFRQLHEYLISPLYT